MTCALLLQAGSAAAQSFNVCATGSEAELRRSIAAHDEHMYRLQEKFERIVYNRHSALPPSFRPAQVSDVTRFLARLAPRRGAAVFWAYRDGSLCTWLIRSAGSGPPGLGTDAPPPVVASVQRVDSATFHGLVPRLRAGLRLLDAERVRAPVLRTGGTLVSSAAVASAESPREVIQHASALLLPPEIQRALLHQPVDVLVVVPIFSLGSVPFSILELGGKPLLETTAVTVAPGFFAFRSEPRRMPARLERAVVVGDPTGWQDREWRFPPLAGARQEAERVARAFTTGALLGPQATETNFVVALGRAPDLIYLATHGVADAADPRDGSFLLMADGRMPAARIQHLPLGHMPIVVLSACQTALGKDFEMGTIGLARAWQHAGAASVVMSLWSVSDAPTAALMVRFAHALRDGETPEEALRAAMLETRGDHADPSLWAGFTVFGLPMVRAEPAP